jgi:hypothetical protein
MILVVEVGAVLWVGTWLAEAAYKEFISRKPKRRAFGLDSKPTECPACGEIELRPFGVVTPYKGHAFVEYECEECKHYETS